MIPAVAAVLATHVVLWHSYRGAEQQALEQAILAWNGAHPSVLVEPLAIPAESFTAKLDAAIPRGHGPDAFIAAHEGLGEWRSAHLVSPLPGGLPDAAGYLPSTLAPLRDTDGDWGVPLAFKSAALFYRTDRMKEPPATTDALLATCRSAAAHDAACLAYEAGSFYFHAAWLHGFGGRIFGTDGIPHLDTPESERAAGFVRDLARGHLLPEDSSGTLVTQLWNEGRATLAISGPWFVGEIDKSVPYGVAPLPIVSATGLPAAPLLTVEAGFIPTGAHHPDEARQLLAFLGHEQAVLRARVGRQPVAWAAAWSDEALARDPILGAFRAQLDHAVPMSSQPAMKAVWEPAQLALRRILRGDGEPAPALHEADRRIALALRPAPAPRSPAPTALFLGLLLVGGALYAQRRSGPGRGPALPSNLWAWRWIAPAALATLVLVLVPLSVGAGMSLFWSNGTDWRFVGLQNFINILLSRDQPLSDPLSFWFGLGVTLLWTVCNVTLHVVLGVSLALALRDPLLRLRSVYRVLLIIPWAIPNYITALIWKGMFHRQYGAINALLVALGAEPVSWFSRFSTAFSANLVTNVWLGFPFLMVTTLGALSRIPKELEEAASLDGASRWDRLRLVILPLLSPALLPSVVLGAVWTFNMFNVIYLVSGGEPDGSTDILVSHAYRWAFTRGHQYGYAAAYAVLIFLVLVGQNLLARRLSPPAEDA